MAHVLTLPLSADTFTEAREAASYITGLHLKVNSDEEYIIEHHPVGGYHINLMVPANRLVELVTDLSESGFLE